MNEANDSGAPAPSEGPRDSASVLATDQYAGRAGRYLFDPVTGTRQPLDVEPAPALPADQPAVHDEPREE
jgi:hypothetical protein